MKGRAESWIERHWAEEAKHGRIDGFSRVGVSGGGGRSCENSVVRLYVPVLDSEPYCYLAIQLQLKPMDG
jgi:hypothetical protein